MFERIIAAKSEGERQEVIKDFAANCNGMEVRNHNGGEYCCYMFKNSFKFKINVYIFITYKKPQRGYMLLLSIQQNIKNVAMKSRFKMNICMITK